MVVTPLQLVQGVGKGGGVAHSPAKRAGVVGQAGAIVRPMPAHPASFPCLLRLEFPAEIPGRSSADFKFGLAPAESF